MELLKLVVTAAIAYFTVTWSLKKFLREKKWEKKSEAYSRIIEALHHLKRIDALYVDEELERKTISEEERKEILTKYTQAKEELEKYIDMGRYYISDEAIVSLEKLQKTREECYDDWNHGGCMPLDIYETELKAADDCLKEIRSIAIKEIHK